jgi:hypothetical protein
MTTGEYAFARMMSAGLPGADGTAKSGNPKGSGITVAFLRLLSLAKQRSG